MVIVGTATKTALSHLKLINKTKGLSNALSLHGNRPRGTFRKICSWPRQADARHVDHRRTGHVVITFLCYYKSCLNQMLQSFRFCSELNKCR